MPRITIAAVLAVLLLLAPAASAMPVDPVYSGPTAEAKALPELSALVREQESTSGSGNQGTERPAPARTPVLTDGPWLVVVLGMAGAALIAAGLVTVRRSRVAT